MSYFDSYFLVVERNFQENNANINEYTKVICKAKCIIHEQDFSNTKSKFLFKNLETVTRKYIKSLRSQWKLLEILYLSYNSLRAHLTVNLSSNL